jgi:hypothetical protein
MIDTAQYFGHLYHLIKHNRSITSMSLIGEFPSDTYYDEVYNDVISHHMKVLSALNDNTVLKELTLIACGVELPIERLKYDTLGPFIVRNCRNLERLKIGILKNYKSVKTNEDRKYIFDIINLG